VAEVTRSIWLL